MGNLSKREITLITIILFSIIVLLGWYIINKSQAKIERLEKKMDVPIVMSINK